ncbi:hypothetical protein GCM10010343_10090 [Streptomyces avidinii]|nr:hypothetical protein GCM10010343_10090 [Streptomyces avidinii]
MAELRRGGVGGAGHEQGDEGRGGADEAGGEGAADSAAHEDLPLVRIGVLATHSPAAGVGPAQAEQDICPVQDRRRFRTADGFSGRRAASRS